MSGWAQRDGWQGWQGGQGWQGWGHRQDGAQDARDAIRAPLLEKIQGLQQRKEPLSVQCRCFV